MKPTERQQAIAEFVAEQANWWKDSNDIDSPTHECDLRTEMEAKLEEHLSENDMQLLEHHLVPILKLIRVRK